MKYQKVRVKLDCKENYIVVYALNSRMIPIYSFKTYKNSDTVMKFANIEIAKLTCRRMMNNNSSALEFRVVIGGKEYNMNQAQKVNGLYQLYDSEAGIKYYIEEFTNHAIERIGYLSIENGIEDRCDRSYGIPRSKELFAAIESGLYNNLLINHGDSVSKVDKISRKEFIVYVKGSTARIHILANSKIMDINQERAKNGQRCIPYIKKVDKFITAFIFVTKDKMEKDFIDTTGKVDNIIQFLVDHISDSFENTIYYPIDFGGQITVDRDIISNKEVYDGKDS